MVRPTWWHVMNRLKLNRIEWSFWQSRKWNRMRCKLFVPEYDNCVIVVIMIMVKKALSGWSSASVSAGFRCSSRRRRRRCIGARGKVCTFCLERGREVWLCSESTRRYYRKERASLLFVQYSHLSLYNVYALRTDYIVVLPSTWESQWRHLELISTPSQERTQFFSGWEQNLTDSYKQRRMSW